MSRSAAHVVTLFGAVFGLACGSTERDEDRDPIGQGGSAGDGAAGSGPVPACTVERAFPIWGRPYDAERDCIETETHVDGVACTIQPPPDATPEEHYYSDGFSCLRRLSDGQIVWVFAFNRLGFDTSVWERCPDAPLIAPKGCYAAKCSEAPRSTCSLQETRSHFECGTSGEYDENCCGRRPCTGPADCSLDEECLSVSSIGQRYCWDNPGNPCDCGGPYGGPAKMLCVPSGAGGQGGQFSR